MVSKKRSAKGTIEYQVTLDGLKLSAQVENEIETAIRRTVLNHLATIDYGGDLVISPLGSDPGGGGGGPTQGIHIRALVKKKE
jgi:hypothetical protein